VTQGDTDPSDVAAAAIHIEEVKLWTIEDFEELDLARRR
jgi:hypothetical protein